MDSLVSHPPHVTVPLFGSEPIYVITGWDGRRRCGRRRCRRGAGLALLIRLPDAGGYAAYLLPTMLLIGGFGLAFPAMITLAMSAASAGDAGVTSGVVNTAQQVGAALGVAVLSTLATARAGHLAAAGVAAPAALTSGYRLAFAVGAGLAFTALLVAIVAFLPVRQPRQRRPRGDGDTGRPGRPQLGASRPSGIAGSPGHDSDVSGRPLPAGGSSTAAFFEGMNGWMTKS